MLRNLVCDHELKAFVQITTLSSSDYKGQSTAPLKRYNHLREIFSNNTETHIMLLNTKKQTNKKTKSKIQIKHKNK